MDRVSVFGSIWGALLIIYGMKLGGSISSFWDMPSILIVFGGAFGGSALAFSWETLRSAFKMMRSCYRVPQQYDYLKVISQILQASEIARKEGILALDSKLQEFEDPFMKRGLQMVVDGVDVKIVESVMETELDSRAGRHKSIKDAIDFIASICPAFGLIGTIIGLVGLLKNLNDPSTIGPNMAIALITTFYGAVAANMFLMPFAKKIGERSGDEELFGEIITRGCLLIAGGTHPRIIQERLLAHMREAERQKFIEVYLSEELEPGGEKR